MGHQQTILIIDDNPINIMLLEKTLAREGYRVITGSNGADTERLAHEHSPDLIFLDIRLPGENGFDICKHLRQTPQTADIPIIFISGMTDVASKVRGLSIGAVDYITKPFEVAEVLARTRLHLSHRMAYQTVVKLQTEKLKQIRAAQQAILVAPQDLPEAAFAVVYRPLNEAGGDFYDVHKIGEGIFGYFVADISGHDLGASYLTSALKALIRQNAHLGHTPVDTMTMINRVLTGIMADGQHLTACYAVVNRLRFRLTVVSAGHPPLIHVTAEGEPKKIQPEGDILGAFSNVVFTPQKLALEAGDRFYLYTDGLISEESGISSQDHLARLCATTRATPIPVAVEAIVDGLHPPAAAATDDIMLLGVEVPSSADGGN